MQNLKIIFLLLWTPLALAQSPMPKKVSGNNAKAFVQAMKMAKVIPQKSQQYIDYSIGKINCHTADAYTDGLIKYDCQLDNRFIEGATAKTLYEAMLQLKLPVDAGMSQTRVEAERVFCRIELKQIPVQYHCQWYSNSR